MSRLRESKILLNVSIIKYFLLYEHSLLGMHITDWCPTNAVCTTTRRRRSTVVKAAEPRAQPPPIPRAMRSIDKRFTREKFFKRKEEIEEEEI